MRIDKKFLCLIVMACVCSVSVAQTNGINSPYSRYGFGQLSEMNVGRSAAMGGVAMGLRSGQEINIANPAAYSACDSLTFLLDAAVVLQNANFNNGSKALNAKNAAFDHVVMQFRAFKNVGMAFGFMPFSKAGYDFGATMPTISAVDGTTITPYMNYAGNGNVSVGFIGIGAQPIKGFSIGANFGYMFGDIEHTVTNSYSDSYVYSNIRSYSSSISTYKLDLGTQVELPVGKHDKLTVGASYTLGHDIKSDAIRSDYLYNTSTSLTESFASDTLKNAFQLPQMFSVGMAYNHNNKLTIAVDYSMQKWGDVRYPMTSNNSFVSQKGFMKDRSRLSLGMEYVPNFMSRKFFNRVRYRLGAYYTNQYASPTVEKAGKEYGLSVGFGIPISNLYNGKSVVNISGQWAHVEPGVNSLIKENYLRICVGITFNERWFMKWKVE